MDEEYLEFLTNDWMMDERFAETIGMEQNNNVAATVASFLAEQMRFDNPGSGADAMDIDALEPVDAEAPVVPVDAEAPLVPVAAVVPVVPVAAVVPVVPVAAVVPVVPVAAEAPVVPVAAVAPVVPVDAVAPVVPVAAVVPVVPVDAEAPVVPVAAPPSVVPVAAPPSVVPVVAPAPVVPDGTATIGCFYGKPANDAAAAALAPRPDEEQRDPIKQMNMEITLASVASNIGRLDFHEADQKVAQLTADATDTNKKFVQAKADVARAKATLAQATAAQAQANEALAHVIAKKDAIEGNLFGYSCQVRKLDQKPPAGSNLIRCTTGSCRGVAMSDTPNGEGTCMHCGATSKSCDNIVRCFKCTCTMTVSGSLSVGVDWCWACGTQFKYSLGAEPGADPVGTTAEIPVPAMTSGDAYAAAYMSLLTADIDQMSSASGSTGEEFVVGDVVALVNAMTATATVKAENTVNMATQAKARVAMKYVFDTLTVDVFHEQVRIVDNIKCMAEAVQGIMEGVAKAAASATSNIELDKIRVAANKDLLQMARLYQADRVIQIKKGCGETVDI